MASDKNYICGPVEIIKGWMPGFEFRDDVRYSLDKKIALVELKTSESAPVLIKGLEAMDADGARARVRQPDFKVYDTSEEIPINKRKKAQPETLPDSGT